MLQSNISIIISCDENGINKDSVSKSSNYITTTANSMLNLIIKIDTKFGDDIEVLDVVDIDTLRTNCGHKGAHISRSSLTCNLCNKLASHYGYYENDKNN